MNDSKDSLKALGMKEIDEDNIEIQITKGNEIANNKNQIKNKNQRKSDVFLYKNKKKKKKVIKY